MLLISLSQPDNILLNFEKDCVSQVCICDFGISKNTQKSVADTFKGTPSYMAPEVFSCMEKEASYDAKKADGTY